MLTNSLIHKTVLNKERLIEGGGKNFSSKESFFGNRNWQGKLLLIFWEGLGDAVISIPSISLVRDYYRVADLGVVAWSDLQKEIFSTLPFDLKIVKLPAEILGRCLREDKRSVFRLPVNLACVAGVLKDYDVVASIVSGKSFQTLKKIIETSRTLGFRNYRESPVLLSTPHVTELSRREKYMADSLQEQVRKVLGIEEDISFPPTFAIEKQYCFFAQSYFESSFPRGSRIVVFNLLTGHRNRNLPLEKFLELGDRMIAKIGVYFLVVNFTEEQKKIIGERFGERAHFFKSSSIYEVGSIIKQADLYIGGDTGLSHLSYVLKTPSIVCFGPTSPKTWLPKDRETFPVKEVEADVGCRDYECRTRFKCKQKTPVCLSEISVDQILSLASRFLQNM